MADILVTGQEAYFNEDVTFFKTVFLNSIGSVNSINGVIEFGNGSVNFRVPVNFYDDVNFDNARVRNLNITERLTVGVGTFVADGITGKVGIGSLIPEQKLDIAGSIKIDDFIYDSANSPGVNGYYLNMDASGVRWIAGTPNFTQGIYVQDDGTYIPTAGLAKSFTVLNFKEVNSLGIGTSTITPIPNPSNPNFVADIQTQDLWGFTSGGNIYRMTNVGINNSNPAVALDITGSANITQTLNVGGATTLQTTLNVKGATDLDTTLNVDGATVLQNTLNVKQGTDLDSTLNVDGATTLQTTLNVKGATDLDSTLNVDGTTVLQNTLNVKQGTDLDSTLNVDGATTLQTTLNVGSATTLQTTLNVKGATDLDSTLNVDGTSVFNGSIELNSTLIDINGSTAIGKTDYRLASVGTGVSWRPPGVQTKRSIWVTLNGDDSNSGLLEGDAKRTIGAGASIAEPGDTIIVRSGVYYENNPIGLRTDVCLSGQDLRLVTVIPNNPTKDVFHVRRGCLIENLSFAGSNISVGHTGAGAVAFPPINPSEYAISGYIAPGPATEGETGRWKSPYVRNCTNFMSKSIGMKINGDHATASSIGANLKCMVLDSFTQYNEAGIGVSITNSGYAQLVSLFTIASDIAVYVDSGGQCDLTNSNSSFGNYGLYAVGVGKTEFTGNVFTSTTQETDTIVFTNVSDEFLDIRKPYDGQALFFKLNLDDYNDTVATGITSAPMKRLLKIDVINGGSGYSQVSPPDVAIYDINTNENVPLGPEGIIAEVSPTVDDGGSIIAVDVVNSGRNYLATQNIGVKINGTPTNGLVAVMESIYYTVLEASESTLAVGVNGTYADAVNLILDNLDFIATEAVDRMLANFPTFTIPGGNSKCIADVKLVLKQICHNLQFGGNDKTYDAAKYYIDHPVLLAGEQNESIYAYERARDVAKLIITNQTITKQNPSSNTYTQVKNLSLIADPVTGFNTSPASCTDARNAIDTLVGIVTFAINPTTPSLPLNRTVGGNNVGVTTVTFNEFVPYTVTAGTAFELRRISRILTSGHSFEYIGAGTSINNSTPQGGGVPIKSNEVVALDGAQIPYTSTDQRGNFNIGGGIQINQTTASITGRDFSKAIQAEVTPLILALR
jgi:acyl-[acyl carrier protein]--UDP-N-acetylglucosamine O-acyltransferase